MTAASLIAYIAALAIAVATPGPAMVAVIATGVSRGFRSALLFALGVALADVMLVSLVLIGLAAIAATFGWMFLVLKFAGAAYLIYLGVKMWRAKTEMDSGSVPATRSFFGGAGIGLGNPKAILFHASLMPLLLDLATLSLREAALVIAIVFLVNAVTMSAYAALSSSASGFFQTPARRRTMNRAGGAAMIGTGVFVAAR